ncbi:MAG: hypothetical protein DMG08_25520 [Acidobacteria bacterium]|nr:MAG: hypothetical protein DMG08_25520 [Acidobacteriota bacterium]
MVSDCKSGFVLQDDGQDRTPARQLERRGDRRSPDPPFRVRDRRGVAKSSSPLKAGCKTKNTASFSYALSA